MRQFWIEWTGTIRIENKVSSYKKKNDRIFYHNALDCFCNDINMEQKNNGMVATYVLKETHRGLSPMKG